MAKRKYTRGDNGYFATRVWDGTYNPDGTKHRVNLRSSKSSADLERQVVELKAKVNAGLSITPSKVMFGEYAREWLVTYKSVREINTQMMYRNIVDKHFDAIKDVKLQDIRKSHFQLVINNAATHPRTCQQIKVTFKQVIKTAIQDHLLPASALDDICKDVDLSKYHAAEKRPLTPLEKQALPLAKFTPREKAFVLIIFCCGLRQAEALSLHKEDISLSESLLNVRRSFVFIGNNPMEKLTVKSDNGYRSIPMAPILTEYLKSYLPTVKGTYLFRSRYSEKVTKSSYKKMWASIVSKMNAAVGGSADNLLIQDLTAHIFRHNFCTELCYLVPEISTKKIAQLMGDDERMVLEVYSHIMEERERAADVLSKTFTL